MTSAWGSAWGPIWGSAWGSTALVETPSNPGGRISGATFSRKKWRELREAIAAQAALERRAQEHTGKRRTVLARAAESADQAITAIENSEGRSAELAQLTRAMEAACGAVKVAETIRLANAAYAFAEQMRDDDDEAMMVLLS